MGVEVKANGCGWIIIVTLLTLAIIGLVSLF